VLRLFQAEDLSIFYFLFSIFYFLFSIFYLLFSIFFYFPFFHWPRPGRGLSIFICDLIFAI